MAKNKLQVTYDFNFTLVALNVTAKAYKLAWKLNHKLDISLSKEENLSIEFDSNKHLSVVNYLDESELFTYRLLKNRTEDGPEAFNAYLLPELKQFDYFFLMENESTTFNDNVFIEKIKEIPFVQYALKVDLSSLKSRDNLIF